MYIKVPMFLFFQVLRKHTLIFKMHSINILTLLPVTVVSVMGSIALSDTVPGSYIVKINCTQGVTLDSHLTKVQKLFGYTSKSKNYIKKRYDNLNGMYNALFTEDIKNKVSQLTELLL